ncbi:MAG: prepilin-type N-terminal cleavage/methylation domain-containing protein [Georgfuchsia sp.]
MIDHSLRSGRRRRNQAGLSLIELIFFIVIVSVGLVGILSVLNLTVMKSADPMVRKQALSVAEAMMEEILAKDYQNDPADTTNSSATLGCTPTTLTTCRVNTVLDRQNYNDVDDYNGWNQTGVYELDGTLAPVLGTYTVTVGVAATSLGTPAVTAKQVTVTVSGSGETISLNGFRTKYE